MPSRALGNEAIQWYTHTWNSSLRWAGAITFAITFDMKKEEYDHGRY